MFYRLSPELVLRSRWRPYRTRPGERVLVLAAASTFPPGHPTTRLCLELVAETLAREAGYAAPGRRLRFRGAPPGRSGRRRPVRGGGGSLQGGLAATTRDNARANGLAASVQVVRGSTECLRGTFGVMLGTCPGRSRLDKVAEFTRLAAPDARLILSGFKDTQEDDLRARVSTGGLGPGAPAAPGTNGSSNSRRRRVTPGWPGNCSETEGGRQGHAPVLPSDFELFRR